MHFRAWLALFCTAVAARDACAASPTQLFNPAIDMAGYLRVANEAAAHRETRRVTEDEFIRMSREPGAVVLDARSREKYEELHIRGAINLSFPDFGAASLAATIPGKDTRILIYCNNNFGDAPDPFFAKAAAASLNLSTYIALYTYGYRNVYELGPYINVGAAKLIFESSRPDAAMSPVR